TTFILPPPYTWLYGRCSGPAPRRTTQRSAAHYDTRLHSFFFQAEDGIRDLYVTGVQTCALPICMNWRGRPLISHEVVVKLIGATMTKSGLKVRAKLDKRKYPLKVKVSDEDMKSLNIERSEERRVGKECRLRWTTA